MSFVVLELKDFNAAAIYSVLNHSVSAVVFRNVFSKKICDQISERFQCCHRKRIRADGVPGTSLGSYHYGKLPNVYADEVMAINKDLLTVIGEDSPADYIYAEIEKYLSQRAQTIRAAKHRNVSMPSCKIVEWSGIGDYLLKPHEDLSQLRLYRDSDFEIKNAERYGVFSLNIYLKLIGEGGELQIWNAKFDEDFCRQIGVVFTGYPYPNNLLQGKDSKVIKLFEGDVVLFDSSLIHAVLPGRNKKFRRLSISSFIGRISSSQFVWWT